ncbi:DUF1294 domain-containing protein [Marinomonas sp. THO17]|uniref:DUF1294 domain-containing protein n=1 Tax=Marinomonas sp. THO17 TaxID=3149048 RepID=UPI00336C1687
MLFDFLLYWYIALSLLTFVAYGLDKYAAMRQQWRVQESSLHLLSLFGGWIGALLGQKVFRHKIRKKPFLLIFWLTVFMNLLLFVLAVSTDWGRLE